MKFNEVEVFSLVKNRFDRSMDAVPYANLYAFTYAGLKDLKEAVDWAYQLRETDRRECKQRVK